MNRFSNLIKEEMKKKNISLREVARKSGVDASFLSKVLKGLRSPPGEEKVLKKMAIVLDIDSTYLTFLAGKIPDRFEELFSDPEFISGLEDLKKIRKPKEVKALKREKLSDELL